MKVASAEAEMEARIARLESDVEHIRSDMADVKSDIRTLRDRMDLMNGKIEDLKDSVNARIGGVKDAISVATVWALVLYIALAGTMLATMARGFGWEIV